MKRALVPVFIFGIALFLTSCTQNNKTSNDQKIVAENTVSQESPDLIASDINSDLSNKDIEDLNMNLDPESIG